MIHILQNGTKYLLGLFIVLLCYSCKTSMLVSSRNLLPTFDGFTMLRYLEKDTFQATFNGDFRMYAKSREMKHDLPASLRKKLGDDYHIIAMGKTNIPQYLSFYLFKKETIVGTSPFSDVAGKVVDSFQHDGKMIIETTWETNKGDLFSHYRFQQAQYQLLFKANYNSSFPDEYTSLYGLTNRERQKGSFLEEARSIIKSIKHSHVDMYLDFFELNDPLGGDYNVYCSSKRKVDSLKLYYDKQLTRLERDILLQLLATHCSFIGDVESATYYARQRYSARSISSENQGAVVRDAIKYIPQASSGHKALFINESHYNVQSRQLLRMLLPELKKNGYNKLAVEALNKSYPSLPKTDIGFYTREPVFGELLREAASLGFQLICYEDTSQNSNWNKRDSIQAVNLARAYRSTGDSGKLVVLAGVGHIFKQSSQRGHKTMATYFTQMTGVEPYCIDTEKGHKVQLADLHGDTPFILLPKGNDKESQKPYDIEVYFPANFYQNDLNRLYGNLVHLPALSKQYNIRIPLNSILLVYLTNELQVESNINKLVPVLSRYGIINDDNQIYLPSRPYTVVIADLEGNILSKTPIQIK